MGRLNTVILYGLVPTDINYTMNQDGVLTSAKTTVAIGRREYAAEDMNLGGREMISFPVVLTRNSEMIRQIYQLSKGDMVVIHGNIVTQDVAKYYICTECHSLYKKDEGVVVYIDPYFVRRTGEHFDNIDEGLRIVRSELAEASVLFLDGKLIGDVEYYENKKGNRTAMVAKYKLGVTRQRRIYEDAEDKTSDYPVIRSFGKLAKDNRYALHHGSDITIKGTIQTRRFDEGPFVCGHCGNRFTRKGMATEVIPYQTEYRSDFEKAESTHQKQELPEDLTFAEKE